MMPNRRGNVLLYVLLAVALLAALAYAISGDMRGQQAQRMPQERAELLAVSLMSHVTALEKAVFDMTQFGKNLDDIKFDLPGSTDYQNNRSEQIFHTSGGGVTVFNTDISNLFNPDVTTKRGWIFQNQTNVEWSATSASDLIYTFLDLNPNLCALLNKKITGSEDIPEVTFDFDDVFTTDGNNTDLTATICPECEEKSGLCIKNGNVHAFYYIIGSR